VVQPVISPDLRDAIASRLERREQVLLYQNRRGHSTTLQCWECGWASRCDDCDVALTYHASGGSVRCHYCGHRARAPETCPGCGGTRFRFGGVGTQKVEEWLAGEFPAARVLRVDLDTVRRKGAHERLLASFAAGDADILLGTQMIAKGLDFPRVTLVGVIQADTQLHLPDFRSSERTFQLLTQVAGRAGRGDRPGEVLLQTMSPDHPAIQAAAHQDFERFALSEMIERDELLYPPSGRLTGFLVSSPSAEHTESAVARLADIARGAINKEAPASGVIMLGPAPRPIEKLMGRYRWQILLKGRAPRTLARVAQAVLAEMETTHVPSNMRITVDVDPQDLL
jgi:primosomal protein N' (replication factor Y)